LQEEPPQLFKGNELNKKPIPINKIMALLFISLLLCPYIFFQKLWDSVFSRNPIT